MSRVEQTTLKCPECGNEQPFTYWQIVNVTSDPDLKKKVLDRTLFNLTCERCGYDAAVGHSLLYHDVEKQLVVFLGEGAPDDSTSEGMYVWSTFHSEPETRFRLVSSIKELIEKILIWDAGLDDRVVEVVKLLLEEDDCSCVENGAELYFSGVLREGGFEVQVDFELVSDSGKTGLSLPFEDVFLYMEAEASYRLPAPECEIGQWLRVDQEYALSLEIDESDSDTDNLDY